MYKLYYNIRSGNIMMAFAQPGRDFDCTQKPFLTALGAAFNNAVYVHMQRLILAQDKTSRGGEENVFIYIFINIEERREGRAVGRLKLSKIRPLI